MNGKSEHDQPGQSAKNMPFHAPCDGSTCPLEPVFLDECVECGQDVGRVYRLVQADERRAHGQVTSRIVPLPICTAQLVNYRENQARSYATLFARVRASEHPASLAVLEDVGEPPWTDPRASARSARARSGLGGSRTSRSARVLQEEAQHFGGRIGTLRIGVGAVRAATHPGVAATVHAPVLDHHMP